MARRQCAGMLRDCLVAGILLPFRRDRNLRTRRTERAGCGALRKKIKHSCAGHRFPWPGIYLCGGNQPLFRRGVDLYPGVVEIAGGGGEKTKLGERTEKEVEKTACVFVVALVSGRMPVLFLFCTPP